MVVFDAFSEAWHLQANICFAIHLHLQAMLGAFPTHTLCYTSTWTQNL